MNEKDFNAKLVKNFTRIYALSFEACGLPSVPDLFCQAGRGAAFWMEGKIKATSDSAIPFRPGQERWACELIKRGGIYFVVCWLPRFERIQLYNTSMINDRLVCVHVGFIPVGEKSWAFGVSLLEDRLLGVLRRKLPHTRF